MYPEGWLHQAFTFRRSTAAAAAELSFGLVQKKGGPCGVLAVVQAFILKFWLFQTQTHQLSPLNLQLSQQQQEKALVSALTYILTQVNDNLAQFFLLQMSLGYSGRFLQGGWLITFSIHSFSRAFRYYFLGLNMTADRS